MKKEDALKAKIKASDSQAIRRRFMNLNRERKKRIHKMMRERQQVFFDLLPLFIHTNDERLPCFVKRAPFGISDFRPAKKALETFRRYHPDIAYRHRALPQYDIYSIFLMGSSGTIAHSEQSDFDIWVCVRSGMAQDKIDLLREKLQMIEGYADEVGLEVHFFVLDADNFRAGNVEALSSESSGTTQHRLLLDEFYRSSLHVAGRYPIWWLVPSDLEGRYDDAVNELVMQKKVTKNEFLDFGGVGSIPAGEFFGATVWQLYKGIDSPYKSVLKIQLLEIYASEYPDIDLLSMRFKETVHRGDITLDLVDPYVMMVNKVQEYLIQEDASERLELARRCFYFKADMKLSKGVRIREGSWRRELLTYITGIWGWDRAHLMMLDSRAEWKITRVNDERHSLVNELTRSYSQLSAFAREHSAETLIDPAELNILGRKLYTAFERKAGKIEFINPGISSDLTEPQISIHQVHTRQGQDSWWLYRGNVDFEASRHETPIKRSRTILELIAWCFFNGVIGSHTAIVTFMRNSELSVRDIKAVLDQLRHMFPSGHAPAVKMESFARPVSILSGALFVNLGVDPMNEFARHGHHLISDSDDALRYGGSSKSLAQTFDVVLVTTWQEVLTFRYTGVEGLLDALCGYINWTPFSEGVRPQAVEVLSYSSLRSSMIGKRIEQLFANVVETFFQRYSLRGARYLLQAERSYYILYRSQDQLHFKRFGEYNKLLDYLAEPASEHGPIVFDDYALRHTPLPYMLENHKDGVIQCYYQKQRNQTDMYVVDEHGALFHQQLEQVDSATLLNQFGHFFEAVMWRSGQQSIHREEAIFDDHIQYYQVTKSAMGGYSYDRLDINHYSKALNYFSIQVISEAGSLDDTVVFSVYVEDKEFSGYQFGDDLFNEVASYILKRRTSGERYPIYITDIDVSPVLLGSDAGREMQTAHYLKYKKRFESRLNKALQAIR